MALERTFSIIKPDAVRRNLIGIIQQRFEQGGLNIVAARMVRMDRVKAATFYNIHRDRPFFTELMDFMTSGPCVVQVLEGENAINRNREIMGATDPAKAAPGSIRADFGTAVKRNIVHGADSAENAKLEISQFFGEDDIFSR